MLLRISYLIPERTSISIIIPTLDEADFIAGTLASIPNEPGLEVIVVDGGSRDDTPAIAQSLGARVLFSPPGRARQMNRGAATAERGYSSFFCTPIPVCPKGLPTIYANVLENLGWRPGPFVSGLTPR